MIFANFKMSGNPKQLIITAFFHDNEIKVNIPSTNKN